MNKLLKQFSIDELLEEIVSRRNIEKKQIPKNFCDECEHFPFGCAPENNYCKKGHKMKFLVPDDYRAIELGEWGCYKNICKDRLKIADLLEDN